MYLRLLILMLGSLGFLSAETREEILAERAKDRAEHPERYAQPPDDPSLPRVLLIGDSISAGYVGTVRERLKGQANVHRIPDNGGATDRGLLMLDDWLGTAHWDIIHFNFGLHDIKLNDADKSRTAPDDYPQNLREIIRRLRATGARLVLATSTPVPGKLKTTGPRRRTADMIAYNAAARDVMTAEKIPVNDLYAVAFPRIAELQLPIDVHFNEQGYHVLGEAVAQAIRAQLPPR